MNKSTSGEQPRVRLAEGAMGGGGVLPPGAAMVLLQMLRAASQGQPNIRSQPPLAA
jgi:hypothetical protein